MTDPKSIATDLKDEETKAADETTSFRYKLINKARKLKNTVNTSVVDQSKKAENWYMDMAGKPLELMAKMPRFEQIAADIKAIQNKTIQHGYDLMRMAISKADDINDEILTLAEKKMEVLSEQS